jgi:TolB-like protein/Tfp pilus assembly protein PilF
VAEASHAVFLSYASQDAEAAQKIAEALRAGRIEVFLDQSELRGGDAWDQKIRKQIKTCALFIPVISRATHDRREGYFRLEWKLAVDRSHLMDAELAFLLPVVIDDTRDDDERVPDRFREVQWTRLPGGDTPPAFVERVQRLLSPGEPDVPAKGRAPLAAALPAPSRRATGGWRWRAGVLAVVAAVVVAVGYVALKRSKPAAQLAGSNSIAVLPLANESGDGKEQYFSDGISEDLITALSQFPGLKVIGRTSAFQFRDSKEDSRSIGAKLQVAHLLEGSVRRSGDVVRVSAELISTEDGSAQWSEHYDRPYKDLFALQDDITRAVAGALRTKLLLGEHAAAQSERPPSGSLDAYNALLQGRFHNSRGTEADARKAIEFYTQAIQLDPQYALAWSELSEAWTGLGQEFSETGPEEQTANAKGREAANRALAISPELAAAHLAQGYLLQSADLNWRGAEAEFRRANELAPNSAEAKFYLGTQLAAFGEVEPAIELMRQALVADPLRADYYYNLSTYLSFLNRLDEAERAIRRAIELQPAGAVWHWQLASIEIQRGNVQAALDAARHEVQGTWQDITLALARQIGSNRAAADAALGTLIEQHAAYAYEIAEVYALRNDVKETFAWLNRAFSDYREPRISYLLYDPFIARYKDDPRFAAFCKKVGLPTPAEVGKRN